MVKMAAVVAAAVQAAVSGLLLIPPQFQPLSLLVVLVARIWLKVARVVLVELAVFGLNIVHRSIRQLVIQALVLCRLAVMVWLVIVV